MTTMRRIPTLECPVYEPTPRDIRRSCKQIRATSSLRTRAKRRVDSAATWFPPIIRLTGLLDAVHEDQADSLPYFGAMQRDGAAAKSG